jgi:hypothetical protein
MLRKSELRSNGKGEFFFPECGWDTPGLAAEYDWYAADDWGGWLDQINSLANGTARNDTGLFTGVNPACFSDWLV